MKHDVRTTATRLLRRAPLPLVTPLVHRRIRRMQADPVAQGVARRQMEFLLSASRPDADIEAAAMRHLERRVWRGELRWRPDVIMRQEVSGLEHLSAVRGAHGGLILCFMHHGQYDGAFGSLALAGSPHISIVIHSRHLTEDSPEYLRQQLALVNTTATAVDVGIGFRGLSDLVTSGATVAIAVDQPGSTPLTFAGQRVKGSSGAARIAFATDTPVVLMTSHPTGGLRPRLEVSAPLLPADYASAELLLEEIITRMEPAVVDWPEAADWPRSLWNRLDAEGDIIPDEREPGQPVL